jgi:L-alanine-DL-glutamate epimerase-like enolase superfamily enzyme
MTLRIIGVEAYAFDIRMHAPFRIATMIAHSAPNVLVCLRTDGGIVGWGEASPLHSIAGETQAICLAAAGELRPLLLERNPLEIAALVRDMDRFLPHNATIKSAFDMALHDIAAQAAGMPLYRLLGGAPRHIETDMTLGIGVPEETGARARDYVAQGYRILKVKLGTTLEEDRARLRSIRAAVGAEVRVRIDANQGWDRATALRALNEFAEFDIEYCEQPLRAHDVAGLRMLTRSATIPVMADEALFTPADALRLIQEEAAPYFNIKLSKSGGIHNALKIAAIAEAGGVRCMVGCMLESRLGLTAAAHLACASEAIGFYDLDTYLEQAEDPVAGGITVSEGVLSLPDTPGLGAAPTPEALGRMQRVV